ncbi:hypothetical protein BH10BAC5_BH10BAC5_28900 [soil metagenome]
MKSLPKKVIAKFFESLGLECKRIKGDHEIWNYVDEYKCLRRPLTIRTHQKDIPLFHIHTNLKTLNISKKEFEELIKKL